MLKSMGKNMLKVVLTLTLAFGLLTTVNGSNTEAGELIDFLPEVQFMRAMAQVVQTSDPFLEGDEGCSGNETLDQVPNSLWVDSLGNIRTSEGVSEVLAFSLCALTNAGAGEAGEAFESGASFLDPFLTILSGEVADLNGVMIDGGKEPIRVGLTFSTAVIISFLQAFGAPLDDPEFFGEDVCNTLRGFVSDGPTFELSWVGFIVLGSAHAAGLDDPESSNGPDALVCSTSIEASTDELLALAQAGNIDAAFDLAITWDRQVGEFLESDGGTDFDAVQAKFDEFFMIALDNTGWAPLVNLALSIPFISLSVGSNAF